MVVTRFRRQALFIGAYRAISVNPEAFPGISPDTVYPGFDCDDKPSSRQVGGGLDGSNVAFPHTAVDCLSLCISQPPRRSHAGGSAKPYPRRTFPTRSSASPPSRRRNRCRRRSGGKTSGDDPPRRGRWSGERQRKRRRRGPWRIRHAEADSPRRDRLRGGSAGDSWRRTRRWPTGERPRIASTL